MPLYLFLDLAAVAVPLAFSFEKRLQFYKMWGPLFFSILVVGLVFIAWDSWFTRMGIWGFNSAYLSGIYLLNLPVEDFLFFICVPYASVFTFHVFKTLLPGFTISEKWIRNFIVPLSAFLFFCGIYFYSLWYTCSTFLFAAAALFASYKYFKKTLPHFILSFGAILLPFFIMNGILTGSTIPEEVVWYNDAENLGIRLWSIPVEDVFYGLSLILWNVNLTAFFQQKFFK